MQTIAQATQALLASPPFHVERTNPSTPPPQGPPPAITWDWHWKRAPGDTAREIARLKEMRQAALDFLTGIAAGGPPRWLTFIGQPGCGKTHLADRIRWWLRAHGEKYYKSTPKAPTRPAPSDYTACYPYAQEGSLFAKWSRLLDHARDGDYHPLRLAARDHYKIIDDLGVDSFGRDTQATTFATQKMAELLDRRLGKWTVFTTNFTLRELAHQFDPRISSRLLRGHNLVFDCGDLRDFGHRRQVRPAAPPFTPEPHPAASVDGPPAPAETPPCHSPTNQAKPAAASRSPAPTPHSPEPPKIP